MSDCRNYADFKQLYRGKCKKNHCFGNIDVGSEYVCPKVGPGGISEPEMNDWFNVQVRNQTAFCHGQLKQLGRNTACKTKTKTKGQSGGGCAGKAVKYTADGRLVTGAEANAMCKCSKDRTSACARGGGCSCNDTSEQSGDFQAPIKANTKYPRETCGCKKSSECGYTKYNT